MLSRSKQENLRRAIQTELQKSLHDEHGDRVVELDGREYGYNWRNAEARISVCDNDGPDVEYVPEGPEVDYVFRVRVELVAVEAYDP